MPRRARLDAPGTLHHVMVRGIERGKIVGDDADRENFVSRLGDLAADTQTAIYAWALITRAYSFAELNIWPFRFHAPVSDGLCHLI